MEQWRKNLYILWGAVFILMAGMSSIIPFLPLHIEQNMGIESGDKVAIWSGLIFGINFLTAFLFSPFWGRLADRYGRKIMILRSGFGMAIVIALMGLATNVYQLFFLRMLNGVISGFNPSAIALVAVNTPKEKVGYALGILRSGSVAGTIIGPFFGGFLANYIEFREIFLYTGLLTLIAAFIVLFFLKEEFTPDKTYKKSSFVTDIKILANTDPLLPLFGVGFFMQFAILNVMPIIPLYIGELDPPGGQVSFFAGLVASSTGFASMLSSPRLGMLGDKYGSEKVLFYAIIATGILFIPQAFATNVWQLMIWRFLQGITLGGLLPSIDTLIRHFAPKGMESRTYGYNSSSIFLGNMLGPIVGGVLSGIIGYKGVFIFTAILLLINGFWIKNLLNKRIQAIRLQEKS